MVIKVICMRTKQRFGNQRHIAKYLGMVFFLGSVSNILQNMKLAKLH